MPIYGPQLIGAATAPMTAAEIAAAPANTIGAALQNIPVGVAKNVNLTALAATVDGSKASNATLTEKPVTLPTVNINGSDNMGFIGDGTKVGVPFYYSADNGVTAKTLAALAVGDTLYANPTVIKYPLSAGWILQVAYRA